MNGIHCFPLVTSFWLSQSYIKLIKVIQQYKVECIFGVCSSDKCRGDNLYGWIGANSELEYCSLGFQSTLN